MASLRDIRKRIKSVKNTQKITKAMKMVSAAKLRRAQEAVEAARPYADKVDNTVSALAARAAALGEAPHPLLSSGLEEHGRIEVIVLTSDRGLCGGFNSNTVRRAQRFQIDESPNHAAIEFATIGKKGNELLKARKVEIKANYPDVTKEGFAGARKLAETYCERFMDEDDHLDGVYLLYNKFKGDLTLKQLLPVIPHETTEDLTDYEYEPSREELLDKLLRTHFATQLHVSMLETTAAEHLARMMAMDAATTNAGEMVGKLTLVYNRARQAAITKELMEIIGGAEALK